jgi:HK97 gp10 family phage protein
MKAGIKIEGADEIDAALKRMATVTRREVVERALLAGGEEIAAEARRLVPADTGNLRASIIASTTAKGMNSAGGSSGSGDVKVFVGPEQGREAEHDGFYGHMVEFGTNDTAAEPFMRPAFDGPAARRAAAAIGEVLASEIDKQAI